MSANERTNLRVLNDNVDLGDGKFLPQGIYPGQIEWLEVAVPGGRHRQIGRVLLDLTEDQIAAILEEKPRENKLGMSWNATDAFLRGDIVSA